MAAAALSPGVHPQPSRYMVAGGEFFRSESELVNSMRLKIGAHHALLLTLSCAAGCVDAVSYLQLGNVFTANMTGHAVLLGIAVVEGKTLTTLYALLAIVGFVGGAAWGGWITTYSARDGRWSWPVTRVLVHESVVLVALALIWAAIAARSAALVPCAISASAFAMGLQSAAMRSLNISGVATTYITGTLTSLACMVVERIRKRKNADPAGSPPATTLLGAVWITYVLGAVLGATAAMHAPRLGFIIPAALVTLVTALAAWRFGR
jgi:uncharacterized membrane protein YoaK (UPF0700 family)